MNLPSTQQTRYIIAFILVLTIVFIEDIDILYNPYMIPVNLLLLILTIIFVCNDSLATGALLISIFVLVYIQYFCRKYCENKSIV